MPDPQGPQDADASAVDSQPIILTLLTPRGACGFRILVDRSSALDTKAERERLEASTEAASAVLSGPIPALYKTYDQYDQTQARALANTAASLLRASLEAESTASSPKWDLRWAKSRQAFTDICNLSELLLCSALMTDSTRATERLDKGIGMLMRELEGKGGVSQEIFSSRLNDLCDFARGPCMVGLSIDHDDDYNITQGQLEPGKAATYERRMRVLMENLERFGTSSTPLVCAITGADLADSFNESFEQYMSRLDKLGGAEVEAQEVEEEPADE